MGKICDEFFGYLPERYPKLTIKVTTGIIVQNII